MARFALINERYVEDTRFIRRILGCAELAHPRPIIKHGEAFGTAFRYADGNWVLWYNTYVTLDPAVHLVGCETPQHIAYSNDGLNWTLPELGIVEINGSKANNAIIGSHQKDAAGKPLTGYGAVAGFCVVDSLLTPHPHARSRYTAMYHSSPPDTIGGICLAHSDDGIHWTAYPENPVIPGSQDTQNCFLFDSKIGKYVCFQRPDIYTGVAQHANRKMARCESDDLIHWSPSRVILDADERDAPAFDDYDEPGMIGARGRNIQFQGMTPFLAADMYLAFTWRYDARKGVFDCELVRSHDGIEWKREALREPFLDDDKPKGFVGKLPVPLAGAPIDVGDEHWFYFSNSPYDHHEIAVAADSGDFDKRVEMIESNTLYALKIRRDRWVGYEAGELEGELLTTAINWAGNGRLLLNATIAEAGHIRVGIEDRWGRPITDWHLDEINTITGPIDSTEITLTFGGQWNKSSVKLPDVGPVRLRLFMKHATLWAFTLE